MTSAQAVIRPDLSSRPLGLTCEREMVASPSVLFRAWTTDQFDRWFAAPGTVLMRPEVNVPFFFETRYEGERHPHYGRFLRIEPDRLVELTWITAAGTKGHETVVTIDLSSTDGGTHLCLTHAGFADEQSKEGHAAAWPDALQLLDEAYGREPRPRRVL